MQRNSVIILLLIACATGLGGGALTSLYYFLAEGFSLFALQTGLFALAFTLPASLAVLFPVSVLLRYFWPGPLSYAFAGAASGPIWLVVARYGFEPSPFLFSLATAIGGVSAFGAYRLAEEVRRIASKKPKSEAQ